MRWKAAWILAALAGCVGPPGGPPEVEVGGGLERFEPLSPGQDVDMIEGAQGGWHLWVSVRVRNMEPDGMSLVIERAPAETMRPLHTSQHTLDLATADGAPGYEVVGIPAVLSQPECFQDREVLVRVTVEDTAGRGSTDEQVVVPRWPEPIGDCAP